MTLAILIIFACLFLPVALFLMGKGEPKGTGAVVGIVAAVDLIAGIMQVVVFADAWTGAALIAFGILFGTLAYVLLAGVEDFRSVGNVSLCVSIICVIYAVIFLTTGHLVDGKAAGAVPYFGFCFFCFAILTFLIFLFTYGKVSASVIAYGLIIVMLINLWVPAFGLMIKGTLPF
jgi:putative amide transporter protein